MSRFGTVLDMNAASERQVVLSTSALAAALGVAVWCIRRVVQRGQVRGVRRLGKHWMFWGPEDVPPLMVALVAAGYLDPATPAPSFVLHDQAGQTLERVANHRPPLANGHTNGKAS
jgi:hypothetical protein